MTVKQAKAVDRVGKICGAILALAAVFAMCWKMMAEPQIQGQIDKSLNPVVDVLEYQTYLMMQTLDNEQLERAERGYLQSKKMKVRK